MKKKCITMAIILGLIFVTSACSGGRNSKLFTTEYKIEDYCENAIIVSKSDGKVYGLLKNNGKEILPLDYDELKFMNKDNYVNGYDDMLYLCAEYEGENLVLDMKGKEVLRTSNYIYSIDLQIKGNKTETTPFFRECVDDTYKIYNQKGDLIAQIPECSAWEGDIWISDRAYCRYDRTGNGITTYNYDGEKISEMDVFMSYDFEEIDKLLVFVVDRTALNTIDEKSAALISIDTNGNISTEKQFNSLEEFSSELKKMQEKHTNKKYKLYHSNETWKLEDLEGNSLYEERYFETLEPYGENDCVALTNDDNQVCIIGRDGKKYIDFGIMEYEDGDDEKVFFVFDEEKVEVKEIYEGKESIIIPIPAEKGYDIYYYES